jgi:hypothetical protein
MCIQMINSVFWNSYSLNVSLDFWVWWFMFSGMWHIVTGLMISDDVKDHSASIFCARLSKSMLLLDHLTVKWRLYSLCCANCSPNNRAHRTKCGLSAVTPWEHKILYWGIIWAQIRKGGLNWHLQHSRAASVCSAFPLCSGTKLAASCPPQTVGSVAAIATSTSSYSEGFATQPDFSCLEKTDRSVVWELWDWTRDLWNRSVGDCGVSNAHSRRLYQDDAHEMWRVCDMEVVRVIVTCTNHQCRWVTEM